MSHVSCVEVGSAKKFEFLNLFGTKQYPVTVMFMRNGKVIFASSGVTFHCVNADIVMTIDQSGGDSEYESSWFSLSALGFSFRLTSETFTELTKYQQFSNIQTLRPVCGRCEKVISYPYGTMINNEESETFCSKSCFEAGSKGASIASSSNQEAHDCEIKKG